MPELWPRLVVVLLPPPVTAGLCAGVVLCFRPWVASVVCCPALVVFELPLMVRFPPNPELIAFDEPETVVFRYEPPVSVFPEPPSPPCPQPATESELFAPVIVNPMLSWTEVTALPVPSLLTCEADAA